MTFDTIHAAYLAALSDVLLKPQHTASPRGLPIFEIEDYTFLVTNPIAEAIVTNDFERNKTIASYTEREFVVYNSGTNKADDFVNISKFWDRIRNPDNTVNSAYGHLIFHDKSCGDPTFEQWADRKDNINPCAQWPNVMRTPWEWAKHSLVSDKDSRQAVLKFHKRQHLWVGNKDQTCTMHGKFRIRNDRLNFTIVMRSNDLVKGTVYDVPWFISLMDRMVAELQDSYPGLRKGTYRHVAHSLHIYQQDVPKVRAMLGLPPEA